MNRWLGASLALMVWAATGGCTGTYLYDPNAGLHGMVDRSLRVSGRFCTEPTSSLSRPIKLLVAMDTSESMTTTDPDGTRATALVELLESLPDDPEIFVGVMLFAGDVVWLTSPAGCGAGGQSGFAQLAALRAGGCVPTLEAKILTYAYAGAVGGANRDTTDFVKPLDEIFATISADLSHTHQASQGTGDPQLSRYSVIFLSDGHPREGDNQNNDIFIRCKSIRGLRSDALDVTLNTVFVFNPTLPVPTYCSVDAGGCQELIVEHDMWRLAQMADLGGGEFRSFRDGEPINFLSFRLGGVKRAFLLKDVLVFNLNARPGSDVTFVDSDADGISDAEELTLGTDPTKRDSDGDGISDGVESYFNARATGCSLTNLVACPFTPQWIADGSALNKGCPANLKDKDLDHDQLLDCDELLIGTSNTRFDTDADGLPDAMEWLGGTQPGAVDCDEDPDRDGLVNSLEVRMHTNPLKAEDATLTDRAYRYQVHALPLNEATGRQCYDFHVDNVLLVPTLDTGEGPGVNHLMMTIVEQGGSDLTAPPLYRLARFTARYPVGGIKDPPDGLVPLNPEDFVAP
jgi:hypothetical protein